MRSVLFGAVLALSAASSVVAQMCAPPQTTIDCANFRKLNNGNWYSAATTVLIGTNRMILLNQQVGPHWFNRGGVDVYEAIERKCGGILT
jgi:opacity protein-like surface antigen